MISTIIKTDKTNIAQITFKKGKKIINWNDLEKEEQIKILNTFSAYYELFYKLVKQE